MHVGSHRHNGEHLDNGKEAEASVVVIEPVSIQSVIQPYPPYWYEQYDELKKANQGQVGRQMVAYLRNGDDEDEIVEEF